MPYVLGIDIGSTCTVAAICRLEDGTWGPPEVVRLAPHSYAVPSVLHMSADGSLAVGDPGQQGEAVDTTRIARGFSRRIGDDVPLVVGGEACTPQALTAVLAGWVVERVIGQEGEHPEQIVLTHPANWGRYRKKLLHYALWEIGLVNVRLAPEPSVAALRLARRGEPCDTTAVYALGGNSCEVSVVRRVDPVRFDLLGHLPAVEPFGGADIDEVVANHVRARLGSQLNDPKDPLVRITMLGLRRQCARAKEQLSAVTDTDVHVELPHGQKRVRLSRAEVEELVRPALQASIEGLARAIRICELEPHQLDSVLLTGGSARMPLVAQLIAERFPQVSVEVEADPQASAATGAALLAGHLVPLGSETAGEHHSPPDDRSWTPDDRSWAAEDEAWSVSAPPDAHPRIHPEEESAGLAEPPHRPPVQISPLKLPRARVASRLVPGHTAE